MLEIDDFSKLDNKMREIVSSIIDLPSAKAGYQLADWYYQLLGLVFFEHEDGARIAVSWLRKNLGEEVYTNFAPGVVLHATALRFFEPIIKLERKAVECVTLLEGKDLQDPGDNGQEIEDFVPPLKDPVTPAIFDTSVIELLQQFSEAPPATAGGLSQQVFHEELREAYYSRSQHARIRLLTLQIHFPIVFSDPARFGDLYHGFSQAWFRHILKLQKWLRDFSEGLSYEDYERMKRAKMTFRLQEEGGQLSLADFIKRRVPKE
jgi:hypothetical protein